MLQRTGSLFLLFSTSIDDKWFTRIRNGQSENYNTTYLRVKDWDFKSWRLSSKILWIVANLREKKISTVGWPWLEYLCARLKGRDDATNYWSMEDWKNALRLDDAILGDWLLLYCTVFQDTSSWLNTKRSSLPMRNMPICSSTNPRLFSDWTLSTTSTLTWRTKGMRFALYHGAVVGRRAI